MTKPTTKIGSPTEWVESIFKDYQRPAKTGRNYDLLVAVCGREDSPGPRDSRFEFILDMGMPKLDKVLKREPLGEGPHFFIFPDRWLVPAESAAFTDHLNHNPDVKKFGRVYCVVHQPYIVSDCHKEEVRIVRKEN